MEIQRDIVYSEPYVLLELNVWRNLKGNILQQNRHNLDFHNSEPTSDERQKNS